LNSYANRRSEQQNAGEDSWLQSLAGLRRCYADGDMIDNNELMQRVPRLTTVRDYATRVLTHDPFGSQSKQMG
jgi:hypothetical protein